jgi:hypothetical protein
VPTVPLESVLVVIPGAVLTTTFDVAVLLVSATDIAVTVTVRLEVTEVGAL